MLSNYRVVFREPGTAAFCLAALVMRVPLAMYALGFVLIVSSRTGHYSFAGVLSACYVLGAVPGNPWLARLTDREQPYRFLDLGTGSGCLLIALLHEYPNASGIGVDVAPGAAATARHNAARFFALCDV